MPNADKDGQPKARLSREALVTSAIALADTEGLEAVTVRRLAQQHSVAPTSLYWHFRDKERLLDGIAEHLLQQVEVPEHPDGDWPEQLRDILARIVVVLRAHPAAAQLIPTRLLASPAGLAVTDRTLALLKEAGLPAERIAGTAMFLLGAVVSMIAAEPGRQLPQDKEEREDAVRVKRALLSALPPRNLPVVVSFADHLCDCADPDTYYDFNLDVLVAGIARMAATPSR
ncbi:TetR/AcrR family transcriptional regulator C-terminal domain-containing protein [Streptomyces sp. NPDC048297]|uniref:TetR/AcrR family transcriptional regulator C-terminal domain-containing protein n=1 Tax=Streptomyces sp. NPDC048297 TaxID=3365531 RepID=UPI00371A20DC